MTQTAIPFLLMRGGTSRGLFFNQSDLPKDRAALADVLISALGAGHPLNIDGMGGGSAVTTKTAILSKSPDKWADIDYFFAQISVEECSADFRPSCGNMLVAVGAAAVEMGLMELSGQKETEIRIRATNTGAKIISRIHTEGGVRYDGDTVIDGVPGSAAPVFLSFKDVMGSVTGKLLPTGNLRDTINGIEVTCLDVAMPVVIASADAFGKSGYETPADLNADTAFMKKMLALRQAAAYAMGLGDVTNSVTPKFALIAAPRGDGALTGRYFMPWKCHPSMAVTGAQCLSSCILMNGTITDDIALRPDNRPALMRIEHPAGFIDTTIDYDPHPFAVHSADLIRTARKIASGHVFVPKAVGHYK